MKTEQLFEKKCPNCSGKLTRCTYNFYCIDCGKITDSGKSKYVDVEWEYRDLTPFEILMEKIQGHLGVVLHGAFGGIMLYIVLGRHLYAFTKLLMS